MSPKTTQFARYFAALSAFVLCVAISAHAQHQNRGFDALQPAEKKTEESTLPVPDLAPADIIAKLTLPQKVAQLMIVTMEGAPRPNSLDREFIQRYPPGGVIIPAALRPESVVEYITMLRTLPIELKQGIGLLIGTDLYALPRVSDNPIATFFVPLPSLMAVAAAGDPESAARLAKVMADHLAKMGFNFHLGPSLELAPTLADSPGSINCLGSDPRFVADTGCALLKSLNDSGIVAMPMGFPGGGFNRRGKSPAVLLTPGPSVRALDLLPYMKAIEQGVPIIHVGNTLVPTLDNEDRPASVSPIVIHDILREELKFTGVIVAGPMDTTDISVNADPSDAAIASIKAGSDMILWNQASRRVMKTVDDLVSAVQHGEIEESRINESVTRILELKQKFGLRKRPAPKPKDAEALSKKNIYPQEAYEIERRSITLVQNHGNVLPLVSGRSTPVGVTGVAGVSELKLALQKPLKAVVEQPIETAKYGGEIYDFEMDRLTSRIEGLKTAVVVMTPAIKVDSQIQLMEKLQAKGVRVVVVLIGYPKMLPRLSGADAILVAYCEPNGLAPAMRAVAEILLGKAPVGFAPSIADVTTKVGKAEAFDLMNIVQTPSGRLPVSIEPPYTAGLAVPYDPSQAIKKVLWDFGDGTKAKTPQAEHAYQAAGQYPINVTVTDLAGTTTTHTINAHVE